MKRTEDSLRDIWDNIKCTRIRIIGVPKEEQKKKGHEKFLEGNIAENFPNMEKEIVNQVQEAQRVPYRINPRRNTPRHTLIELIKTKHKERILKAAREKQQVTYKGNPIYLTADLSVETLQARREWQDIFKVLKGKNLQRRLQYLARISFKIYEEIKSFLDKQKLREFSTTKPALEQMLNGLIQSRNTREEKRSTKLTPNSQKNDKGNIYINNYFKCKWVKCSNQKIQTG